MKGLIAKDIAIIKQRSKAMLLLILWAVLMAFSMDDISFVVGWIVMIAAITSLSTIAYDEHDNCMPYILSMPVTRRGYAVEKYIFALLLSLPSWLLALLIGVSCKALKGQSFSMHEEMPFMLIALGIMLIMISVSIPPQLKWGAEKGRLIMILIAVIGFGAAVFLEKMLRGDMITHFSDRLNSLPQFQCVAFFLIFSLILTAISMLISIRIMETKEI